VQEPPLQPSAVPLHEWPQLPQLLLSIVVLRHAPVQHDSEPPQVRPQAPQFPTSEPLTLVHVPEQQRDEPPQDEPDPHLHTPKTQVSPVAQLGLQGTSVVQEPARQTSPTPVQAWPQLPQWVVLVARLAQVSEQQLAPAAQRPPEPHLQVEVVVSQVSPVAHAGTHGDAAQVPPSHT